MDEYVLMMRLDILTREAQPTPEQMAVYMQQYQKWVDSIAAENKFCGGTGLSVDGKVLQADDVMIDGPYVEMKESIAGFITIRATDMNDAVRIAKACPILGGKGNSVEVRKIISVNGKKTDNGL